MIKERGKVEGRGGEEEKQETKGEELYSTSGYESNLILAST